MHKTHCVLAILVLYAGLAHSFSWDVVISRVNRLEFYNEGTLASSVTATPNNINWITYDPFHNRILFSDNLGSTPKPVFSYGIATKLTETLTYFKKVPWTLVYDPARELLFAHIAREIQSFLLKPGSGAETKGTHVINVHGPTTALAVDSCKGYIYWTTERNCIERARYNGSEKELLTDSCEGATKTGLAIDSQTQKIYWAENQVPPTIFTEVFSADLDGSNKKKLYHEDKGVANQISVSKEFIYWVDTTSFGQLPKNASRDTDVKPKRNPLVTAPTFSNSNSIASNYAIEEQSLGNPDCKVKSHPSKSETPDSDIPACHNYCLQGHCSASADGLARACRCNAGYSGHRCEVDLCLGYCLNEGVCSLNGKGQPVCRCSKDHEGDRCETSVFPTKIVQHFIEKTASMINDLKDILIEDGASATECKGGKCASPVA